MSNEKYYGGAIGLKESIKYESETCTFKDNEPDDVHEERQSLCKISLIILMNRYYY